MKKRFLMILLLFFVLPVSLLAQDKDIEIALEKGIESYMNKDYEGAIKVAEGVLKLNPENQQAKDLLLRCLKKVATNYYEQGDYKSAVPYFERASGLFPDDQETAAMLKETRAKVDEKERDQRLKREAQEQALREQTMWKNKLEGDKRVQMQSWKDEMERRKARDLKLWQEELEKKKQKEEEEMFQTLGIREKEWEVKLGTYRRSFLWGGIGFFILVTIFVVGIFVWGRRVTQIRDITQYQIKEEVLKLISQKTEENWTPLKEEEDKILAQTEKILQIEDRISRALEEKIAHLDEKQTKLVEEKIAQLATQQNGLINEQTSKMLKILEVNQEEHLIGAQNKVLDLLEKTTLLAVPELVEQWKREQFGSEQAKLAPSTHVLKVTQRAKELYQADPEKAIELLRKLSEDQDRWVRVSVVSALNEIDELEGIDMLISLLKDREKSVKTAAYQALERKVARGRDFIPEDLAKKILEALRRAH